MTLATVPNGTDTSCGCDPLCLHDFGSDRYTSQYQVVASDFVVNLIHPVFGQLPIGAQNPNGTFVLSWVFDVGPGTHGGAYYSNDPNYFIGTPTEPHLWVLKIGDATLIPPGTLPYPFGVELYYFLNTTTDNGDGAWAGYYVCEDGERGWVAVGLSDQTSTAAFPGQAPHYYDGWSAVVTKL